MTAAPGRVLEERPVPRSATAALTAHLGDLAAVIRQTPPALYTQALLPDVSGSIGQHVRHILDHVAVFVGTTGQAGVTYDCRQRNTAIELDVAEALRTVMRLTAALSAIDATELDRTTTVSAVLRREDPPTLMRSTRRRELAFVISHTVHHQALIAVLLAVAGHSVPRAFGVAPTTPGRC